MWRTVLLFVFSDCSVAGIRPCSEERLLVLTRGSRGWFWQIPGTAVEIISARSQLLFPLLIVQHQEARFLITDFHLIFRGWGHPHRWHKMYAGRQRDGKVIRSKLQQTTVLVGVVMLVTSELYYGRLSKTHHQCHVQAEILETLGLEGNNSCTLSCCYKTKYLCWGFQQCNTVDEGKILMLLSFFHSTPVWMPLLQRKAASCRTSAPRW